MLSLNIIHVGNLKERYYAEATVEYEKRLKAYCTVTNREIREARLPDAPSDAEISHAVTAEGEAILAALPPRCFTVALCVEGKELSSEELASVIDGIPMRGFDKAAFIIGGSNGLSDKVKSAAQLRISFSKMTFPHRLMRVILCEQLYRAFTINAGAKYHK